ETDFDDSFEETAGSFDTSETDFDDSFEETADSFDTSEAGGVDDWTVRDDATKESDPEELGDSSDSTESDGTASAPAGSSRGATETEFEGTDAPPSSEAVEDDPVELLDLEDDSGDSFEETFGTDALDETSLEDEEWFDTAETGSEDEESTAADEQLVTVVEEPDLEIPELTVPDSIDRDDEETIENESQSVRVDVEQIDDLLNLVEGLVTSRVRLRHAVDNDLDLDAIDTELDDLEDLLTDLQGTVMDVRLVPVETVTNRLPRVVRDVAREQDKEVAIDIRGSDVEIDRTILDRLRDPLVHLVRNAVDHGIEPPEERDAATKPREGQIEVRATRTRDQVTITVSDDGRGLDPDQLTAEAVDAGVITEDEARSLSDDEAFELVFHPGLSTAEEVTDVSGRGVGMDVVERTVTELDGTISVDSEPGSGTTVTMTLPVSLAIDDVLFVECGGEEFGIPTTAVHDVEPVEAAETVDGESVLAVGDERYSVLSLADELETPSSDAENGMLVRIRDDVRPVALECDSVRGQQEVVVKPFEGFMRDIPGISGATVRGRGEVVTILDVTTL
ncbi:chemotaxis protein CheA, partial [Salinadaptatus halalkaliphilus]|uniref:chemotaxis protein CheA n=1 Tax=Salinadaptatus halalkaliphilus TaxID=2419781 RepID=UPI00158107A0